ncbi:hypothetical protein [Paenibacillus thalictri]|uniref:Uncharacterized protein n=1 Tax=Paenibacillus thalictri TaxID=2527873 RepID=A0A4Q9DLT8_9BACL|nr:hypothetical protein [Paenibacillus thalictri]TBL76245.1 hypothetical protein EYB31_19775 [Paenibacillus thalictri]
MSKPKPLTIPSVRQTHAKQFGDREKVELKSGHYLFVQKSFAKTNIQRFLAEYIEILEQLKKNHVDSSVMQNITFVYYMLLLRHFTSLTAIPSKVEEMIEVCGKLIDLDILEQVLNAFDPKELEKMNAYIRKIEENSRQIGQQVGELLNSAAAAEQ